MLPEVASRRAFFIDAARHLSQRKVEFEPVHLGKDVGRRFFCMLDIWQKYTKMMDDDRNGR